MLNSRSHIAGVWIAFWFMASVFALPISCLAEVSQDEFGDFPVVLSASRLYQPLIESPSAITVIDRQMIQASGVRQIADLMRFVPGTVVGYNDGNRPVVSMHGMSGTFASGVQVLIDGVSVYSPLWGGMQWEELPLSIDDVERIEVIRGPNAAAFGANSFAGVINIITIHPSAEQGCSIASAVGNSGVADFSSSCADRRDNQVYRWSIGQRNSDGFSSRPDTQRFTYANLRSEFSINGTDSLSFTGRISDNKKDNGDYTASNSGSVPHPHQSSLLDFKVRLSRALSVDDEWWFQFYHQQSRTADSVSIDFKKSKLKDMAALLAGPIPYVVNSDFQSQRDGFEFQRTQRVTSDIRTVWGVEARRDAASSITFFGSPSQQTDLLFRAFGNVEWRFLPKFTANFANAIERSSFASTGFSPKLSLTWQPVSGHVLRVVTSSAQRLPSIYEERANYGYAIPSVVQASINGSAALQAALRSASIYDFSRVTYLKSSGNVDNEHVKVEELGYSFDFPEFDFSGDARWAWEHHSSLVKVVGDFPNADFVNVDRVEVNGGDLTLKWKPHDGTLFRLALGRSAIKSPTNPSVYNQSSPETTVSFLWDQDFSTFWKFSLNYQRVGEMHWTDAGSSNKNPMLPSVDYLNLKLSRSVSVPGFSSGQTSVIIQNALGDHKEYYAGAAVNGTVDTIAQRVIYMQFVGKF